MLTGSTATLGDINGFSTVRFTSDIMTGADVFGGSTGEMQLFMVSQENTRSANRFISFNGTNTGNPGRFSMLAPWSNGTWYWDPGDWSTQRATITGSPTAVGDVVIVNAAKSVSDNENTITLNQGAFTGTDVGAAAATTTGGLRLGGIGGDVATDHELAEFIVFDRKLSDAETDLVEQYLAGKWQSGGGGVGGNDTINGGAGNDSIYGQGGDDILNGGADDDTIDGGTGADTIDGGTGADTIDGGTGADTIDGEAGDDTIDGGTGADTIDGGTGNDVIYAGDGDDDIDGGDGDDIITASDDILGQVAVLGTGDYDFLIDGVVQTMHVDFDGTDHWLLVGRGREGWDFDTDGEGAFGDVISNLGTSGAFAPAAYSDSFINDVIATSGGDLTDVETRIKRAADTAGNTYQEIRWSSISKTDWTFDFDGADYDIEYSVAASTLGGGFTDLTSKTRDTMNTPDTDSGNAHERIFTWAWTSHDSKRGFSYGLGTEGVDNNDSETFLWEQGTEGHAIGYSEVYIKLETPGNLTGSDGNDIIDGGIGNDTIIEDLGADTLTGGAGIDTIAGGAGDDTINLANGDFGIGESITGGADTDTIILTNATTVDFTTGTIATVENLTGSTGDDDVTYTVQQALDFTTIDLKLGTDTSRVNIAGTVDVTALGTPTVLNAENGFLTGSTGNDDLTISGAQVDALIFGAGIVDFDTGTDVMNITSTSADLNTLGAGTDVSVLGLEEINASTAAAGVTIDMSAQSEDFILTGSANNDTITAGTGADTINGGAGDDTIDGGTGNDTLYANVAGSSMDDGSTNVLNGGDGDDTLYGSSGTDTLNGGDGDDTLNSGSYPTLVTLLSNSFPSDEEDFTYNDIADPANVVVTGSHVNDGDAAPGSVRVYIDCQGNFATAEGAYDTTINSAVALTNVQVTFSYRHWHATYNDAGEDSEVYFEWEGTRIDAIGGSSYISQALGSGGETDTGWKTVTIDVGDIAASTNYDIALGIVHNGAGTGNEDAYVKFDDVTVTAIDTSILTTLNGGDGLDDLYGSDSIDVFVFESASAFNDVDTVTGFTTGDDDALDISDVLDATAYNAGVDTITDWIQITDDGTDSTLFVDRDGTGGTYGFDNIASILGTIGLTDEAALVASGNIIDS